MYRLRQFDGRRGVHWQAHDFGRWSLPKVGSRFDDYSTVTLFAKFRGLSIGRPFSLATWYANSCR